MATIEVYQQLLRQANQSEWFEIYLKIYALGTGIQIQRDALLELAVQCISIENGVLYLPGFTKPAQNALVLIVQTGKEFDNDVFRATVIVSTILAQSGNELVFVGVIDPMKRTQPLVGLIK